MTPRRDTGTRKDGGEPPAHWHQDCCILITLLGTKQDWLYPAGLLWGNYMLLKESSGITNSKRKDQKNKIKLRHYHINQSSRAASRTSAKSVTSTQQPIGTTKVPWREREREAYVQEQVGLGSQPLPEPGCSSNSFPKDTASVVRPLQRSDGCSHEWTAGLRVMWPLAAVT